MFNYFVIALSVVGLIALSKFITRWLSDLSDSLADKRERKILEQLYKKAYNVVYANSFRETYRRGKLEVNNLAMILEEVKEIDATVYDDLVLRLSQTIRREEMRQGLIHASKVVDLPNHFGDDTDDDLINFDKD